MAVRNDKAAVAKAAKAVDRVAATTLLTKLLANKVVARLSAKRREAIEKINYELTSPSPKVSPSPIGASFGASSRRSPSGRLRGPRKAPRRGNDWRKVEWIGPVYGTKARGGSKRAMKANWVREEIGKRLASGLSTPVYVLVGAYYDNDSLDKLSLHDLDVMVEKNLITISD